MPRDDHDYSGHWASWTRAWTHAGMLIMLLGAVVSIVSPFGVHPVDFAIAGLVVYCFELHRKRCHRELMTREYGSIENLKAEIDKGETHLLALKQKHIEGQRRA